MPLSFLHPGLLFGAAGAAVPLLLHLWRRRRARREPFPDLTFLEDVQRTRARALGIRRWLLLLLRMLVILLAVLAAAGPRWGGLLRQGDGLLVLVDGSGSLTTVVAGESRAAEAAAAVRSLLAAAPRNLPVQVVLAAGEGRPLLDDWVPAAVAASLLPRPWPRTDAACDLPRALSLAADLARAGPARRPRLVLVTDGQAPQASPDSLDAVAARLRRLGISRLDVRLVGRPVPDGGVVGLAPLPGIVVPGQPLAVQATVRAARPGQRFWLELSGERAAEVEAPRAGSDVTLTFPLAAPVRPGLYRAVVRTDPDRRPDDDAAPLLLPVRPRATVRLRHGTGGGPAGRGGWRFLAAALSPADSAATPFHVVPVAGGGAAAWQGTADLVVLVDPEEPTGDDLAALRRHLVRGGGVWLLCGRRELGRDLRARWLPLLGLTPRADWREPGRTAADQWVPAAATHPLVAGWPPRAVATLGQARWYRFWRLGEPPDSTVVPWRFAGGGPALVLGRVGAGRFAVSPWDLEPAGNDLAANPMFPPLAQRLAGFLAAGTRPVLTATAGRPVSLPLPPAVPAAAPLSLSLVDPLGHLLWRRSVTPVWRGVEAVVAAGIVWRAGVLSLSAGDSVLAAAAVREPGGEVTAPLLDPTGWRRLLAPAGLAAVAGSAAAVDLAGRDLSAWFWLLAVAVLVAETAAGRGDPDTA